MTAKRLYRCGICGTELRAENWIFSQHSKARYCHPRDWTKCESRSLRNKPRGRDPRCVR
jgi:DNA-directed RNA polymerase subunit RPC12/RpoP